MEHLLQSDLSMKKVLFISLVAMVGLVSGTPVVSAKNLKKMTAVTQGISKNPEDYIRQVPGDFLSFMRSNPAWSWAWFQSKLSLAPKDFQSLGSIQGVVSGDAKPDNVDIVVTAGQTANIGLIDLDDGGNGPLLGDIFHTLTYNQIWPLKLSMQEALNSYSAGLNGQNLQGVRSLQEIYDQNLVWHPPKSNQKKLKKMKESEKDFLEKLKLISLKEAPVVVQELYDASKSELENQIAPIGVILRTGLRLKESGGSANVPRFVMLVENNKYELGVVEFKLQPDPAVAAAGIVQLSSLERLKSLANSYRPFGDLGVIINFLETPYGTFIVREKRDPIYDGGEIPSGIEADYYLDYVRHMFWWLGQAHSEQSRQYVDLWNKNTAQVYQTLEMMVLDHIAVSERHYQKDQ